MDVEGEWIERRRRGTEEGEISKRRRGEEENMQAG
jgi:hypothetical protein